MSGRSVRPSVVADLCACVLTFVHLGAIKIFFVLVSQAARVERYPRLFKPLLRQPWLTLAVAHALLVSAALPFSARLAADHWGPGWGTAARVLVVYLGLCLLDVSSMGIVGEIPNTFDGVERSIRERWPERRVAPLLERPIDAIFVRLMLVVVIGMGPAYVALLVPATSGPVSLLHYFLSVLVFSSYVEGVDHVNIHNQLFRTPAGAPAGARVALAVLRAGANYIVPILGGRVPNWYRVQHVTVHHAENNGLEDTQTTVRYDRTSFFDFCRAAARMGMFLIAPVDVMRYLHRRGRRRPLKLLVRSYAIWVLAVVALAFVSPIGACAILGALLVGGVGGAINNFNWHALADPKDPQNTYVNSVTFAAPGDHAIFGAFVHMEHHLHPAHHWSRLGPDDVAARAERAEQGSLVFQFFGAELLRALWTSRYERLHAMLVPIEGQEPMSLEAFTERVHALTRPIEPRSRPPHVTRLDKMLGSVAARLLVP